MLTELYRRYIPKSLRDRIYQFCLKEILYAYRSSKEYIYAKSTLYLPFLFPKTEKTKAYAFVGRHGRTMYPDDYSLKYKSIAVDVNKNEDNNLYYVIHKGKKLYFPRFFDEKQTKELYLSLIIEQDESCPHRYVRNYSDLKGKVLLDIGAAEGIFSLDTIEYTSQTYLFECESYWIEALEATFEPWKDKIQIIRKYVGSDTSDSEVSLDSFCDGKSIKNVFIKMDIEGAELDALKGAKGVLENEVAFSICVYHKQDDLKNIAAILDQYNYKYEVPQGLLYVMNQMRHGIIRSLNTAN